MIDALERLARIRREGLDQYRPRGIATATLADGSRWIIGVTEALAVGIRHADPSPGVLADPGASAVSGAVAAMVDSRRPRTARLRRAPLAAWSGAPGMLAPCTVPGCEGVPELCPVCDGFREVDSYESDEGFTATPCLTCRGVGGRCAVCGEPGVRYAPARPGRILGVGVDRRLLAMVLEALPGEPDGVLELLFGGPRDSLVLWSGLDAWGLLMPYAARSEAELEGFEPAPAEARLQ